MFAVDTTQTGASLSKKARELQERPSKMLKFCLLGGRLGLRGANGGKLSFPTRAKLWDTSIWIRPNQINAGQQELIRNMPYRASNVESR